MKITAAGWARDCGTNEIAEIDLNETRLVQGNFTYGKNDPVVTVTRHAFRRERVNGVVVSFFANVRLGGDYGFKLKLSKSEIARLFYLTHKDEIAAFVRLFPNALEDGSESEAA